MKKAAPLFATCALLLSFSATAQPTTPPTNCSNGCTVVVSLAETCGSGVKVSIDPIYIGAGAKPTINWVMASESTWSFANRGVDFVLWDAHASAAFESRPAGTAKKY